LLFGSFFSLFFFFSFSQVMLKNIFNIKIWHELFFTIDILTRDVK
jgi:hypothetical protein